MRLLLFIVFMLSLFDMGDSLFNRRRRAAVHRRRVSLIKSASPSPGPTAAPTVVPTQGPHDEL